MRVLGALQRSDRAGRYIREMLDELEDDPELGGYVERHRDTIEQEYRRARRAEQQQRRRRELRERQQEQREQARRAALDEMEARAGTAQEYQARSGRSRGYGVHVVVISYLDPITGAEVEHTILAPMPGDPTERELAQITAAVIRDTTDGAESELALGIYELIMSGEALVTVTPA